MYMFYTKLWINNDIIINSESYVFSLNDPINHIASNKEIMRW